MKKTLRIIQIGTQHDHAPEIYGELLTRKDTFELVGIVEDNEDYREKFRKEHRYEGPYFTWEQALAEKPDAFTVETEEHGLVPWALKAVGAGYPVHMDKPGSENSSEFHRLCNLAKEKKLPLSLGYMYRYNPAVMHAKKLAEEGALGEIFSVEAQMSVRHTNEKRQWLSRFEGGMLYFLGCHLIDLVVSFCGFPEEVIPLNCNTGVEGNQSRDYGFCVLKYKNGVSFVKSCATEINGFDRRQLVVTGSKGTVEIRPLEIHFPDGIFKDMDIKELSAKHFACISTLAQETLHNDKAWGHGSTELTYEPYGRYEAMMQAFASFVRGEAENPYTYDYEARLHDLILQCCRAQERI